MINLMKSYKQFSLIHVSFLKRKLHQRVANIEKSPHILEAAIEFLSPDITWKTHE